MEKLNAALVPVPSTNAPPPPPPPASVVTMPPGVTTRITWESATYSAPLEADTVSACGNAKEAALAAPSADAEVPLPAKVVTV